ncbi:MAG: hypothetical protein KIS94_13080 [Chitinophagales bacterium]|nr:hypothetical protein [Chitinophagales bacterium]
MDFLKRTFPILLGIFLLSVLVRLPQLNRPLSKHHEFCTAVSLRIMQIWYDNGIEKYNYNPVMTYNHPADKFINNHANQTGKMVDSEGNYYYVSHPPFAYYFPFFIFKALHIRPDVLPLQIFNLLLHFISGLFVYFTVCLLSFNRARSLPYRSALVAYAIYLFLPVTLWFQGNVYMSDMAVHALFIIGVYTALKMIIRQKFYVPKYIFLYVLILALMIYTSWLGVFFAFGVFVYSLLHLNRNSGFKVLLWSTVIVTLVMLRLMAYQYSQINGPMAYIEEMFSRYLMRGSLAATNKGLFHFMFDYLWLFKTLLYNYIINYIVVYVALALFVWLAISRKKLKIVFSDNGYRFIWLSVMPVVLLHVFFLNYSEHDFTALYASLFFSVLMGILYDKVKKSGTMPLRKMQIGLLVLLLVFVAQYQVMNLPDVLSYSFEKDMGEKIKSAATPDEVIFFTDPDVSPQTVFYAGRNVRYAKDATDAIAFLKATNRTKGVLLNSGNRKGTAWVEVVERISL